MHTPLSVELAWWLHRQTNVRAVHEGGSRDNFYSCTHVGHQLLQYHLI